VKILVGRGFLNGRGVNENMKSIRLDFCDFHPGYRKTNNFFYNLLRERFAVEICDQPDFLIYSYFGHQHRLMNGIKIFFTGESVLPNWAECDYALTCHDLDTPRHLRLPWYVLFGEPQSIIKAGEKPEEILAQKTKFCSFVVSGHNPRKNANRVEFFQRLSRYKHIDSGGRYLNNIGGPIPGDSEGKVRFLRDYKFNIAFENAAIAGYTTEKIFEAMQARTLPIYWGDPQVERDFNPRSFLNLADFADEAALIEKIIELDRDDNKYLEYLCQPYFHADKPNEYFSRRRLLDFFERVFTERIEPVSRRKRWFAVGRWTLAKRHHFRD
jgi:alpha(1,3/1,4) fucosyltransferase